MLRVFQQDLADPDQFVVTLELVPGNESAGRWVDTVKGIARNCFADGRLSAVKRFPNKKGCSSNRSLLSSLTPQGISSEFRFSWTWLFQLWAL